MEVLKRAGFDIFEAHTPEELVERSYRLSLLPWPNRGHTYALREPSAARDNGRAALTRQATRKVGSLQVSRVADRLGTRISIGEPGMEYYCFSLFHGGAMSLSFPDADGDTVGTVRSGSVHRADAGLRATTLDGTARTNIWVLAPRMEAILASLLGDVPRAPLVFNKALDLAQPSGASLGRLIAHVEQEFAQPNGVVANPQALAALTDLFIHTALQSQPHNYSERLSDASRPSAPRNVRRAEAFIRAHALEPLTMQQIAAEAECSIRALQLAFRQFRSTTPYQSLVAARLDGVRRDLEATREPIGNLARRWGFTNAGRFAGLYRRRFGKVPSAVQRGSGAA